jgi:hypothetical protein
MRDLVKLAIDAHGGMRRWKQVRAISATLVPDGLALKVRGQEAFARTPTTVTVDTREQKVTFNPFLAPEWKCTYEPARTAVTAAGGKVIDELTNPRESFKPKGEALWTAPQLAYFAGYALWTYLTLPFSLLNEGVQCTEAEPWIEGSETWRALSVVFPSSYTTHSSAQTLYFDAKGLLRRQDYAVDIAGGGTAAHYIDDHRLVDALIFPTRRRIYPRASRQPNQAIVLMAADLSNFKLADSTL